MVRQDTFSEATDPCCTQGKSLYYHFEVLTQPKMRRKCFAGRYEKRAKQKLSRFARWGGTLLRIGKIPRVRSAVLRVAEHTSCRRFKNSHGSSLWIERKGHPGHRGKWSLTNPPEHQIEEGTINMDLLQNAVQVGVSVRVFVR